MWLIQAKERALWARKRKDLLRLPLHRSTWCLVTDPETKASKFELLLTCQMKHMSKAAVYSEIDRGLGIHPAADREWIERLMFSNQSLEAGDYKLLGVPSRPSGLVTVLLSILNQEKKSLLLEMRNSTKPANLPLTTFLTARDDGDEMTSSVRLPLTTFLEAGGNEDEVMKMLQETVQGRKVLAQRDRREIERRRRARCKRYLQRTGLSQCEQDAITYGIKFRGSNNVYHITKANPDDQRQAIPCCGQCSH
jgi:hypothetical protein